MRTTCPFFGGIWTRGSGADADPLAADLPSTSAYSAWLSGRGYASSTIARRLASLRSFYRYQRRQGVVDGRPGGRSAESEAA